MARKNRYNRAAKRVAKVAEKHPQIVVAILVLILVAIIIAAAVWYVKPEIFSFLNADTNGQNSAPLTGAENEIASGDLSIHFLELGNKYTGDSTLIKCGNTEVLIDAGSRASSATTIKSYVDRYCTDGKLEYVIATHAHMDHVSGFSGVAENGKRTGILYNYDIGTIITFAGTNKSDSESVLSYFKNAESFAVSRGATAYTAKQCWYEQDGAAKKYYLNDAKTISLNILYHKYYDEPTKDSDENDYSVSVLLKQELGEGKEYNYLFTGDLEEEGERSLVESNNLPQVELFKGGHHGSYTASSATLLAAIKPKNVAVCCCTGTSEYTKINRNMFPSQAFITRVAKYTENIYCTTLIVDNEAGSYTSLNGNIVFYTVSGELKLWCSNNTTKLKDTEWFKQNRVWTTT